MMLASTMTAPAGKKEEDQLKMCNNEREKGNSQVVKGPAARWNCAYLNSG